MINEVESNTYQLSDLLSRQHKLTPEEVKAIYSRVCALKTAGNRSGENHLLVRTLEVAVGREFRNTAEFHSIMAEYFSRAVHGLPQRTLTDGTRLKRKREALGMTQQQLADLLDVSQVQIVFYEKNTDPLSRKADDWLNGTDTQKTQEDA